MTELAGTTIGSEVGGYRLEALIGRGGMGEVYRAHDGRLDRNVALKILAPRLAEDEGFRERLLRESRLAASLDHPNVVPVYDAGSDEGRFYLAMRYVEGIDLKALLRSEGGLEPARAVAVGGQVADALDAAHARGLVHRDVKPSNVLLDQQDGREHAYLADFGLTQSVSDRGPTDGQLMGTADYVAPEQIRGDDVDGRADVYSLGCLLFETLTGTVPFSGASDVAVVYAHLEQDPPSATERRPELPTAVDDVLARAMAKHREERPATCGELVGELRGALGLEQPPARRGLVVAAAAALALVAIALVTAVALWGRGEAPPPGPAGAVVRVDAATGTRAEPIRVGAYPASLAADDGVVWVGSIRESALWKVTGATGRVERIPASGSPRDIAITAGTTYVASDGAALFTGTVSQYDQHTGFRRGGVDVLACSLTAGPHGVWVAGCPNVVELESTADKLRVARTLPIPFRNDATAATYRVCLCGMDTGFGSVWAIGDWTDTRLWRIDPEAARISATYELPFRPRSFAVGTDGIWVVDPVEDRVARLDPDDGSVTATVPVGRGASGVAVGAGSVWVTNQLDGTVSRIDPATREVTDTIQVGPRPVEVAVDGSDVWVVLEGE